MKRTLLLTMTAAMLALGIQARADRRPMLEQGKTWYYTYHHYEADAHGYDDEHTTWTVTYTLRGDTTIAGQQYMKMYRGYKDEHYFGAYREDEEGRVYMLRALPDAKEVLVIDFNLNYENAWVKDVQPIAETINVYGMEFRRYKYKELPDIVGVEGVGFQGVGLNSPFVEHVDCICDYEEFDYVESNGFRFTNADFMKSNGYIPFVEEGKQWHVARFTPGRKNMEEVDYYIPQGVEEINGNEYYKMKAIVNNTTEIETYLVREEKRKLYLYNPDLETEFLVFDFSLKEGDIYEGYSDELHPMVRFKVVSVGDCTEGPQIREYYYDEEADTMAVRYRYLRKWDVRYADFGGAIGPWSWVEGIGSLMNPFTSMSDGYSTLDHLTYITYNSYVGHPDNYLPFSFIEWWNGEWHGCNMPTSAESFYSEDGHHQLTYELEGKRLHVYGKVLTHGGDNNYAYFIPEPTEDSSVRKFRFKIQEIEPLPDPLPGSDGLALHATDFYVEDLNPAIDYIVVDNQGVEHTVINRAPLNVYRPFVEDGKVWVVKVTSDDEPTEEWFEYYYFDGDTIINGQAAKRMLCDRIGSWQDTSGEYVGAWYEQDKKVYYAANGKQQFELLYDFTMNNYDEMPNPDGSGSVWIVYKWTGIYTGFKGTSYTFGQERWYERVGSNSWPFVNHPWGYPGDKGVLTACIVGDEVIYYNSDEVDPFGMGAKKGRFDFTHTIKIQPKAPARRGAERKQTNDAEALSVYGEYNEKQLCINLGPLDAAYQVSITDESGKTVYGKAVNALNIVALDIDISTYAEGRYTVTVENAQESFTGEFEVQTTGIKVLDKLTISQSDDFYDLQGRKLSNSKWSNGQIRKGIYIKNGRKFVVK